MFYLDANASSRLRPAVAEAIARFVAESPIVTNPSSVHAAGQRARARLSAARQQIRLLFAEATEEPTIIFTSGATEACNAAVMGLLPESLAGVHALCSATEHQAVLEPLRALKENGLVLEEIFPAADGVHNIVPFLDAVKPSTEFVALMAANNVTGVIQPVAELAQNLRRRGFQGVIFCDASQCVGKSDLSLGILFNAGVDAIAISGHKLGAPTGIGALVLSGAVCRSFSPSILGGPQEQRFRAGTENLVGSISLGSVIQFLMREGAAERTRLLACREELWRSIHEMVESAVRLTPPERSLVNTLAIRFPGINAEDLVVALDLAGVCCSTGSACSSGKQETSHVFKAMVGEKQAKECIRLSLDWDATLDQVREVGRIVGEVCARLRKSA